MMSSKEKCSSLKIIYQRQEKEIMTLTTENLSEISLRTKEDYEKFIQNTQQYLEEIQHIEELNKLIADSERTLLNLNLEDSYGENLQNSLQEISLVNSNEANFSFQKIQDEMLEGILKKVNENPNITSINLSNNSITNDGCKTIYNLITSNPNIKFLNLSSNNIGDRGLGVISEIFDCKIGLNSLDVQSKIFELTF